MPPRTTPDEATDAIRFMVAEGGWRPQPQPDGALGMLRGGAAAVHGWLDAEPEPDELQACLAGLTQIDAVLMAARARLIVACDEAGISASDGAATTTAWLAGLSGQSGAAAAREVRHAVALDSLPDVAGRLRRGELSADAATEIIRALQQQERDQDAAAAGRAEEAEEREARRRAKEEAAAAAAADAEEARRLAAQAAARRRRDAKRRADEEARRAAAAEAARLQRARRLADEAAASGRPEEIRKAAAAMRGADSPDALANSEAAQHTRRSLRLTSDAHTGMTRMLALLPAEHAELARALISSLTRPDPKGTPPEERRTPEQRRYDGFHELLTRAERVVKLGTSGGHRPTMVVRTTLSELIGELSDEDDPPRVPGLGRFDSPLSSETIQRLACDATIVRLLTDDGGRLLTIGRASRDWNGAQRRFVEERDGGCAFPGCDRPPGWCDIHHVTYWRHGGRTDVDNGVLLCRAHHRAVHHDGWTLQMDLEGGLVTVSRTLEDGTVEERQRKIVPSAPHAPPGSTGSSGRRRAS